jgi:hypothetical protein
MNIVAVTQIERPKTPAAGKKAHKLVVHLATPTEHQKFDILKSRQLSQLVAPWFTPGQVQAPEFAHIPNGVQISSLG